MKEPIISDLALANIVTTFSLYRNSFPDSRIVSLGTIIISLILFRMVSNAAIFDNSSSNAVPISSSNALIIEETASSKLITFWRLVIAIP